MSNQVLQLATGIIAIVLYILYRIDINYVIKIGDFGLTESVGSSEYFRQNKLATVKLPIRWLAPESLEDRMFSEKSDVVRSYMQNTIIILNYHADCS